MADYISREAAIAFIREQSEEMQRVFENQGGESGFYADAYNDLAEDFYRVPAADVEPVRRWIPCSKRKPKPETEVQAVCRRGGVSFVCPAMYEDGTVLKGDSIWNWNNIEEYGLYCEDADDWFIPEGWWEYRQFNDDDVYNNLIDCAVTHWQPLPEPPLKRGAEDG